MSVKQVLSLVEIYNLFRKREPKMEDQQNQQNEVKEKSWATCPWFSNVDWTKPTDEQKFNLAYYSSLDADCRAILCIQDVDRETAFKSQVALGKKLDYEIFCTVEGNAYLKMQARIAEGKRFVMSGDDALNPAVELIVSIDPADFPASPDMVIKPDTIGTPISWWRSTDYTGANGIGSTYQNDPRFDPPLYSKFSYGKVYMFIPYQHVGGVEPLWLLIY